jgi:hypothetical protein
MRQTIRREYLKHVEMETSSKNKNREFYKGINEFKNMYKLRHRLL